MSPLWYATHSGSIRRMFGNFLYLLVFKWKRGRNNLFSKYLYTYHFLFIVQKSVLFFSNQNIINGIRILIVGCKSKLLMLFNHFFGFWQDAWCAVHIALFTVQHLVLICKKMMTSAKCWCHKCKCAHKIQCLLYRGNCFITNHILKGKKKVSIFSFAFFDYQYWGGWCLKVPIKYTWRSLRKFSLSFYCYWVLIKWIF